MNNSSQHRDSSDESASMLSGRSLAMAQNSLFCSRDNLSVEKYMEQILRDEGSQEYAAATNAVRIPLGRKPQQFESTEQALNFSIRCNNLSSWSIESSSVRVRTVNFRLIQTIIYREGMLIRLRELLQVLDDSYWKYCPQRIRDTTIEKPLQSEALVLKRNKIFGLQNEISVGIAHLRSLSITVIELVQQLRHLIKSELEILTSVSIYWKGENYLLKMIEDCDFFFNYSSSRYWLGFIPNALMIPPSDHDPNEKWCKHCSTLLHNFLNVQKDKQSKEITVTKRKASVFHERRDQPIFMPAIYGEAAIESTNLEDEWHQLRDYCLQSWSLQRTNPQHWPVTAVDDAFPMFWVQHLQNPFFHNADHNPLVVEAALGFSEIWPRNVLVPPLPAHLLAICLRLQQVLVYEREQQEKLCHLRNLSSNKEQTFRETEPTAENTFGKSEPVASKFLQEYNKLRQRQQGDQHSLQGISMSYISSSSGLFNRESPFSSQCVDDGTFSLSFPQSSQSLDQSSFVDNSLFSSFLIEKTQESLKESLQRRVDSTRTMTTKAKGNWSRLDGKERRELSRLDFEWKNIHAIAIQRVFRGYHGRKITRSIKAELKRERALLLIQCFCRNVLAKASYRRRLRERKIETFFLRKSAMHRFRAAVIIANFFRRIVHRRLESTHRQRLLDRLSSVSSPLNLYGARPTIFPPILQDEFSKFHHRREKDDQSVISEAEGTNSSAISFHDFERSKFERMRALGLIKRVNQGKHFIMDSRRSSRLIPLSKSSSELVIKKFSKKDWTFMSDGLPSVPGASSTKDVFVPPALHRGCLNRGATSSEYPSDNSLSSSKSKLTFVDHLNLKEEKRRHKELKDAQLVQSVVLKYFQSNNEN